MKIKLLFLLLLLMSFLLIGCAINEIRKIASNPDFNPKWDVGLNVSVFDKTITLQDQLETFFIDNYNPGAIPIGDQWPVAFDTDTDAIVGGLDGPFNVINLEIKLDETLPDNDFTVNGLYSTDASLTIKLWVTHNATGTPIDIYPSELGIDTFQIEGITYNFSYSHTTTDKKLVFIDTNFLSPSENYFINFEAVAPANQINIEAFNINVLSSLPIRETAVLPDFLELNVELSFDVGNNYGFVGDIQNTPKVYSENNLPIPLSNLPISEFNDFKYEMIFDNKLPFDMILRMDYTADIPVNPLFHETSIVSANTSSIEIKTPLPVETYSYASSLRKTEKTLSFEDDVTTYENMNMNIYFKLANANNVRISPSDYIRARMNISGTATVGF